MDANYFSNEPYVENPIEVVAPTDTTGNYAYAYHYTLDGSTPDESDPLFTSNITLNYGDTLKVRRYGVGSSNNTYHPSPVIAVPNYTPEIVLEECCNLYDQLVWEGNTDKINTFWNNKPLNIKYYIRKIHDTYFLFLDMLSNHKNYFNSTVSNSSNFSDLFGFYCKGLVFYSKDLKTWNTISGFENNFSSPINLRGKLSNKYILYIYYRDNNFHIVYTTINPDKVEAFISAEANETSYNNLNTGGNSPRWGQNIYRYMSEGYPYYSMYAYNNAWFETGGINSNEEFSLYEYITSNIENIEEKEPTLIYANLEKCPEVLDYLSSYKEIKRYLDSRFVLPLLRLSVMTTENRTLISLTWDTLYSSYTEEVLDKSAQIFTNAVLLSKLETETSFKVLKGYSYRNTSSSQSGVGYYFLLYTRSKNEPYFSSDGYYCLPYYSSLQYTPQYWCTRNFELDTITEGSSPFGYQLAKSFFDKNQNLYWWINPNDWNIDGAYSSEPLGEWAVMIKGSLYITDVVSSLSKSYYAYYWSFYNSSLGFYVYITKPSDILVNEMDGICCIPSKNGSSIYNYSHLPQGYKLLIEDLNETSSVYKVISSSILHNLDNEDAGYMHLFNEDNEPILFKIHLENPTKQTTENQISTMALDDKKIYRLQTRRINIEENKESITNETQPLTIEQQ